MGRCLVARWALALCKRMEPITVLSEGSCRVWGFVEVGEGPTPQPPPASGGGAWLLNLYLYGGFLLSNSYTVEGTGYNTIFKNAVGGVKGVIGRYNCIDV